MLSIKNISMLAMSAMIISCGSGKKETVSVITDKKVQLQKLKTEQQKINEQVAKLEAEIAKADPGGASTAARLVAVTPLIPQSFSHFIELQGRVDAQNISYVAPPNGMGGVVTALYVTQGQFVRKGQVLARLDDRLIRQQIEPLRVQLAAAEDVYRRTQNLWDQGIGTYQQVLTAKTQVETLRKQIGVIQRQASLMTVTAPSSGVADVVNVRVGEAFTGANGAGPQIRIVNTGNMKVIAAVPENYLGRVRVGTKLEVVLPEQNNRMISAVVSVVQKVIDANTRSFNIEARIPADAALKPNQIARIKILDYNAPEGMVVPLNVVQSDEKGKYVYVAEKTTDKMLARKRMIVIGESYGSNIEAKSGLRAGDLLITEGYQNLYDGQIIKTNN